MWKSQQVGSHGEILGSIATNKTTSGVSLMTPVSSPVLPQDDTVILTQTPQVEFQPPEGQLGATLQLRTPLSKEVLNEEVQGMTGKEAKGGKKDNNEIH